MKESIYILGVGYNTPVIMEIAELSGYKVDGLYHFEKGREGEKMHGVEIIGCNEDLLNSTDLNGVNFALSMGDNKIRTNIAEKLRSKGARLPKLIHPTASVSKYATIEEGVIIQANSTVQADVLIKKDTVISFNVGISHNTIIENGCYIACQTIVGAYTHILELSFIGMGVTIVSDKVPLIGRSAVVGAGSVVIKPVKNNQTVVGNPAKEYNKKHE